MPPYYIFFLRKVACLIQVRLLINRVKRKRKRKVEEMELQKSPIRKSHKLSVIATHTISILIFSIPFDTVSTQKTLDTH